MEERKQEVVRMSRITIEVTEDLTLNEVHDFMDSLQTQHRPLIREITFEVIE